jgi:hypothetical protein
MDAASAVVFLAPPSAPPCTPACPAAPACPASPAAPPTCRLLPGGAVPRLISLPLMLVCSCGAHQLLLHLLCMGHSAGPLSVQLGVPLHARLQQDMRRLVREYEC